MHHRPLRQAEHAAARLGDAQRIAANASLEAVRAMEAEARTDVSARDAVAAKRLRQQRGSMAGLRSGQASLMAGKPAEGVDGAVQAILHVCEAAEASWGEELCTLIQQAAAAMVQQAAMHQRREAEVAMRTREHEREKQFREKLGEVAVEQHRLRADLRAQEAEAEATIRKLRDGAQTCMAEGDSSRTQVQLYQ